MSDPSDSTGVPDGPEPEPDQRPSLISIDILEEAGDWSAVPNVAALVRSAVDMVASAPELCIGTADVSLALSSDDDVRRLNAAYRGFDKPTNVLSFPPAPAPHMPGETCFLGDIVLAAETVMAEAGARSIPPAHHLQHLVVHGLLHLLGFDHETDAEAQRMERLETRILARLGIPDPYAEATE